MGHVTAGIASLHGPCNVLCKAEAVQEIALMDPAKVARSHELFLITSAPDSFLLI